jgi:serine/threonine protein phosphatase PrpC
LIQAAHAVLAARGAGEDRIALQRSADGFVLALSDGAGGTGGGAAAAQLAVQMVMEGRAPWAEVIRIIDASLNGGQCALVIAAVSGGEISGASVGDCGAWLIGEAVQELTARQIRKPLVGSGARPVAFQAELKGSTLLLASDGLFNYARRDRILEVARSLDLQGAASALAELPRLRSGALPDDVSVILCRRG